MAAWLADRIVVLNGGVIEQIGTPSEIYHAPASTFVASFMGAPPMNLMTAEVADHGLHLGDGAAVMAAPNGYRGPVTMGIRPEDVRIGTGSVRFDVTLVEELGAHRLLHGQIAGQTFTAHGYCQINWTRSFFPGPEL